MPLTIHMRTPRLASVARYSAYLGRRVEVHYRAGDILLPASGTFVADSGRSVFLEQNFVQHGQQKHFRWEIPYQYIVRLEETPEPAATGDDKSLVAKPCSKNELQKPLKSDEPQNSTAATANTSGGTPSMLPLRNRPKTA